MVLMFKPSFGQRVDPSNDNRKNGDYERNLAYAEKFAEDMKDSMPQFVRISFDKTNHEIPRKMMVFMFRRRMPKMTPKGVVGGGYNCGSPTYANHVSLDDNHAECVKNIRRTFDTYKLIAQKYEDKIIPFPDNTQENKGIKND